MRKPLNRIELYVVEVQEDDKSWGPVDPFINHSEAVKSRRGWKRDAPHNNWRVTRYVPALNRGGVK